MTVLVHINFNDDARRCHDDYHGFHRCYGNRCLGANRNAVVGMNGHDDL